MKNNITVFEHQSIRLDKDIDVDTLKALQNYYGSKGVPYFSLIHNGVRFNEYVGVIQVGSTVIEVLPKADNNAVSESEKTNEKKKWHDILVGMLRATGEMDVHAPSNSSLKLQSNTILDLYFELFIREVEYLLHAGLVKQYRKKESNSTALKGSLQFGKHIQQNLTHAERFYVRHTTYDVEHKFHFILYKAIRLLKKINTNVGLHSRIGALLLHFPEMPDLKVSSGTFEKLVFSRKTQSYQKAINIAKLLLLKYHPDVVNGKNDVLALMFDMNVLWEKFVYKSLRKYKKSETTIRDQSPKFFWKPEGGSRSKIIPDIVVNLGNENCVVLDTKWKNLNGKNPSPEDLKQMYVYHQYYTAKRVALIYPGDQSFKSGHYLNPKTRAEPEFKCSVISLGVNNNGNVREWQEYIHKYVFEQMAIESLN